MKKIESVSQEGEIWKSVFSVYDKIHESWIVSNFGRVYRLPYRNGKVTTKLQEIFVKPIEWDTSDYYYFSAGIGKNRSKIVLPFVVKKLFDKSFKEVFDSSPRYYFKDGNSRNNHVDNIVIFYPLVNYPNLLWDFYEILSSNVKNKKFQYLIAIEFGDLDLSIIEKSFDEWKNKNNLPYYQCPPTGKAILKMISDTLKKINLPGGIDSWLNFNGKNSHEMGKIEKIFQVSNSGSSHQSRLECFVDNVMFEMSLIDENFKQQPLSNLIQKKLVDYDPVPDFFFLHPKNKKLVLVEVFGVADLENKNNERGLEYIKKAEQKYELYSDENIIFIDLWVKNKPMKEILEMINKKFILNDIIETPLIFSASLMPKSEILNLLDFLRDFKKQHGIFEVGELKEHNPKVHRILARYCSDIGVQVCEFLAEKIYPEIELPVGEGGFVSVKGYRRNQKLISEITELVNLGQIKNVNDFKNYHSEVSITDRLYRMTKSMGTTPSEWFKKTFPNVEPKHKSSVEYSHEEIVQKLNGHKNRTTAQLLHPGIYKYASRIGLLEKIYPTKIK
jgi:hypothetical protein